MCEDETYGGLREGPGSESGCMGCYEFSEKDFSSDCSNLKQILFVPDNLGLLHVCEKDRIIDRSIGELSY